jgi:uncharacterized protein (TIGR03067 family)
MVEATRQAALRVATEKALTAGGVSPRVVALTQGVMQAMFLSKLKTAAILVLVAAACGAGVVTYRMTAAEPADGKQETEAGSPTHAQANETAEVNRDLEQLRGPWEVVQEVLDDGLNTWKEAGQTRSLVFAKGILTIGSHGDPKGRKFQVRLDPNKTPKAIDLTALDGDSAGAKARGVYRIEGNMLKLCIANSEEVTERPTDFVVREGSQLVLWTLRRTRTVGLLVPVGMVNASVVKKELEKLQGTWEVVEQTGDDAGKVWKRGGEGWKFVITKGRIDSIYYATANPKEVQKDEFLFKLDPTSLPKRIDLKYPRKTERRPNGFNIYGIYQLEGDGLQICESQDANNEKSRPTEFAAEAKSNQTLLKLKRISP